MLIKHWLFKKSKEKKSERDIEGYASFPIIKLIHVTHHLSLRINLTVVGSL